MEYSFLATTYGAMSLARPASRTQSRSFRTKNASHLGIGALKSLILTVLLVMAKVPVAPGETILLAWIYSVIRTASWSAGARSLKGLVPTWLFLLGRKVSTVVS